MEKKKLPLIYLFPDHKLQYEKSLKDFFELFVEKKDIKTFQVFEEKVFSYDYLAYHEYKEFLSLLKEKLIIELSLNNKQELLKSSNSKL